MTARRKKENRILWKRFCKSVIAYCKMRDADRKNGTHKILEVLRKKAKSYI